MLPTFTRKTMISFFAEFEQIFRIWFGGTALFYLYMKYVIYGGFAVAKDK
jgi:hypothetical protein